MGMLNLLNKKSSSFFGIDLGTTGIRAVELVMENKKIALKNYVSLEAEKKTKPDGSIVNKNIQALDADTIESMKTILNTAEVANHKVAMSVPTSSTFSSIITFPRMPREEIEKAVNFEARQYIPIPLDEVVYGWSIISQDRKKASDAKAPAQAKKDDKAGKLYARNGDKTRVLLIAIPKETCTKYMQIANAFSLDLVALETESFSLARSLVGKRAGTFLIIDIGYKMTGITVVDDGSVTESHSISTVGGEEITKIISHSYGVNEDRANVLKKEIGINSPSEKKIAEIVTPILSIIISEVRKNQEAYLRNNGKRIDGIIITGGSARMPGLKDYIADELGLPVEMGNPFKMVAYDKMLESRLESISASYAVAVGLALFGFENN